MRNENFPNIPDEAKESPKEKRDLVRDYMEQMDLSLEDLQKKILDVGSGGGTVFAKQAQERGLGSQIYSIDPNPPRESSVNFRQGRAESLPFNDEEFELVVSNAAFPFFVVTNKEVETELLNGNLEPAVQKTKQILGEMLRVLKSRGKIKLGRVTRNNILPLQKAFEPALDQALNDLVQNKTVKLTETPKGKLVNHKNPNETVADLSLIVLDKLSAS